MNSKIDNIDIIKKIFGEDFEYNHSCDFNKKLQKILENMKYYTIENDNFNGLLVYRCDSDLDDESDDDKFNYDKYKKVVEFIEENEEYLYKPIFVFKNFKNEKQKLIEATANCKNAKEKKELKKLFEKAFSFYTDSLKQPRITFSVDEEGINYLEYEAEKTGIKGFVYNISLWDLTKLLNIQGIRLFEKNIRIGISKNTKNKQRIVNNFKSYIINGIYNMIDEQLHVEEDKKELYELLEENDYCKNETEKLSYFWFRHNGVTIFIDSSKTELNRRNNDIEFDAEYAYVLNGAQTLTNMFDQILDFENFFKGLNEEEKQKFKTIDIESNLEKICKEIKIKTVFIEGSNNVVDSFTEGLNAQLSVDEYDIIANSEDIKRINEKIQKQGMNVIRSGEIEGTYSFSVLRFIKICLMALLEPGQSKNFNWKKLDETMGRIKESLDLDDKEKDDKGFIDKINLVADDKEKDDKGFIDKIKLVAEADNWWEKNKKINSCSIVEFPEEEQEKLDSMQRFGKNYFCSYVVKRMNEEDIYYYDEDTFANYYDDFKRVFAAKDAEVLKEKDYKSDDSFKKMFNISDTESIKDDKETSNADTEKLYKSIKEHLEKMTEYLNDTDDKSSVNVLINQYLNDQLKGYIKDEMKNKVEKHDINFRTVTRIKTKDDNKGYEPKETYPFSSRSFMELNEKYDDESFVYKESVFSREIEKEVMLFVIDKNGEKIEKIQFIPEFSFKEKRKEAENVFNETKKAFEAGRTEDFPKMSDELSFHVRPKALNANDTFEFTNGDQITKRAFYANRDTLKELIENQLKSDEKD
ncbi:hypothetical protein SAMN05216520_11643 [Kandleria vitulina]|uniref:AIPR family protein n=1 Tax=Kandleria vitulina TaxID=1630 RepID=UPI00088397F6|nr:AIPR family protein [Kandleria vitulina]SDL91026.1 hypothetical protein SAMN05216520_11643 [Kandleria vitulina]